MIILGKDNCPHCNALLDAAIEIKSVNSVPKPMDYTICIKCGTWLQFGSDMGLRLLSEDDKKLMDAEAKTALTIAQKSIRELNAKLN